MPILIHTLCLTSNLRHLYILISSYDQDLFFSCWIVFIALVVKKMFQSEIGREGGFSMGITDVLSFSLSHVFQIHENIGLLSQARENIFKILTKYVISLLIYAIFRFCMVL